MPSPRGGEALDFFHLYIKTPRGLTAVTPRLELVVKSGCSLFTYQVSSVFVATRTLNNGPHLVLINL